MKFQKGKPLFFPYLLFGYPSREYFLDLLELVQDRMRKLDLNGRCCGSRVWMVDGKLQDGRENSEPVREDVYFK